MKPKFFKNSLAFREWLEQNHDKKDELLVGFYKKGTHKPSITWPESVDQALCFGWIDGIRRKLNEESYSIRFTPRRPKSIWSAVNVRKVNELREKGLMKPEGLAAFAKLKENNSEVYSFEQKKDGLKLPPEYLNELKKNKKAWTFYNNSAPSYQRMAAWWVISAKREMTRQKRLATLIEDAANGLKIKMLRR